MKKLIMTGAAVLIAGTAFAQQPPPPPPPPAPADGAAMPDAPPPPPPPGPGGPREAGMRDWGPRGHRPPPPPPSKGAHFRLEQGETKIDIKCADEEPMKACAEIMMQLIDKMNE